MPGSRPCSGRPHHPTRRHSLRSVVLPPLLCVKSHGKCPCNAYHCIICDGPSKGRSRPFISPAFCLVLDPACVIHLCTGSVHPRRNRRCRTSELPQIDTADHAWSSMYACMYVHAKRLARHLGLLSLHGKCTWTRIRLYYAGVLYSTSMAAYLTDPRLYEDGVTKTNYLIGNSLTIVL